jgi:endonuclease-3 related protein
VSAAESAPDCTLATACRQLLGMYDVREWWPARSRFEVMVGAVLVQNTRWGNVAKAIRILRGRRCMSPTAIAATPPADLAAIIRPAGCQSVKARRLRAMAEWVQAVGGLRKLPRLDTPTLRAGLLSVHGIGPETADAILCFGFSRRQFVADAYARRWLERMGLVSAAAIRTYEARRHYVESTLQRSNIDYADLHAAIVLHAQERCTVRPECERCGLRRTCRYGARHVA